MLIQPKVRGFLCTTTHPIGCAKNVEEQIAVVKQRGPIANGPKRALIIGSSMGYGLASRIAVGFGSGSKTIGVAFERPAERGRQASPGWYQNLAYDAEAQKIGLYSKSIFGDAFSEEIKKETLDLIAADLGQIDLFIYSLAAPRRTNPRNGQTYRSTLKTIGNPHTNKTLDFNSGSVTNVTLEPASQEEIEHTEAVMGGEDWSFWVDALLERNLLAPGAVTVAYSYIGPIITQIIYRQGTIGKAKDHLERSAKLLDAKMQAIGGHAFTSVNKAMVTQASSAIPYMPLYISLLYKVMKDKNCHEGCIEQIDRLFREKLYHGGPAIVDEKGRIRIDDWEMREDVQAEVIRRWEIVDTSNLEALADLAGYRREFHKLYGFELDGVDYTADVPESAI